jgi:hypothetical protein
MKRKTAVKYLAALLALVTLSLPSPAQDKETPKKDDKKPTESEMMTMMLELAKPGENHKLLASVVGTWDYKVKFWMSPDAPPMESGGKSVSRTVMDGRYVISDHAGKMQMPGAGGAMMDTQFAGMGIEGYDNAKKKFVASWIDNMGTGIMNMEGTYDAGSKTLTYLADYEPMPGMKTKMREVIKIADNDHRTLEFFEDRGGKEVKTMEIAYTRKS